MMGGINYVAIRGLWRVFSSSAIGLAKPAGPDGKIPLGIIGVMVCVLMAAGLVAHHFHPERPFYIGQRHFAPGDYLEISSVERSASQMKVRGFYHLASHDQARLALYITSTNEWVPENALQSLPVVRGRGDFELLDTHLVPGLPHVSLYTTNGEPFGALYFGTHAESLEEHKIDWLTKTAAANQVPLSEAAKAQLPQSH
jgi:hypothetical protein